MLVQVYLGVKMIRNIYKQFNVIGKENSINAWMEQINSKGYNIISVRVLQDTPNITPQILFVAEQRR